MRTLAIETATEACSVALFDANRCIASEHVVLGRGHAERLVPMIEALPDRGKAARILVSLGPGSFTGVRIGIATARALGFAWGAEVLGYSTLALVAAQGNEDSLRPVTVCMNGGHGEWFVQNFSNVSEAEDDLQSLTPEDAVKAARHAKVAGNRALDLVKIMNGNYQAIDILPNASAVDLLDTKQLQSNLSPIYGRAPDAKLPAS